MIKHTTQNNMQHSRQPSLRKITRKNQEHVCNIHSIKPQKRIYPKVAESATLGLL
jgi:hypothetical protein